MKNFPGIPVSLLILACAACPAANALSEFVDFNPNLDPLRYGFIGWVRSEGEIDREIEGNPLIATTRLTVLQSLLPDGSRESILVEHVSGERIQKIQQRHQENSNEDVIVLSGTVVTFPKGTTWFVFAKRLSEGLYSLPTDSFVFETSGGWFARPVPRKYQSALCLAEMPKVSDLIQNFRERSLFMQLQQGSPLLSREKFSERFVETPAEGFQDFVEKWGKKDVDGMLGRVRSPLITREMLVEQAGDLSSEHVFKIGQEALIGDVAIVAFYVGRPMQSGYDFDTFYQTALMLYADDHWKVVGIQISRNDLGGRPHGLVIPHVEVLEMWAENLKQPQ